MSKSTYSRGREQEHSVVISYAKLGTIHPREQVQALVADVLTFMDQFGEFYLTGSELTLRVTNEWGDPAVLRKPTGQLLRRFDTNHYTPACRDYEL